MPIFINGNQYEDEAHMEAAYTPMLKNMGVDVQPVPPKTDDSVDSKMVVTPNQMDTNKQLEAQDDAVLGGTEINSRIYVGRTPLEGSTEPAGEFNLQDGTQIAPAIPASPEPSQEVDWSRYNQPFGEIKGTHPDDTPVVFETKTGVKITEGDIQRGMDIAMSAGPGMVVGGNAGLGTKYWQNVFKYDKMKKAGASKQELLEATGLFEKGPTGRLVHELSDENMKLVDRDWKYGESGKLSDYIDHPKLFEAYPELKDVNFKVADKDYDWIGGFNSDTKTLTINPQRIPSGDEGILDVIAHEVQHWVQVKEGFPRGGNPEMALKEALWALGSKMQQTPEGPAKTEMTKLMVDIANNAKAFANYMYQRIPGEVEANATMARRKLSDQQRRAFPIEEFNKFMEGEYNTMSGGRYYPEFNYPKPGESTRSSAMPPIDPNLPHK